MCVHTHAHTHAHAHTHTHTHKTIPGVDVDFPLDGCILGVANPSGVTKLLALMGDNLGERIPLLSEESAGVVVAAGAVRIGDMQ